MDVKSYFKKIREEAESLPEGDQVVISLETSDGGRAGIASEVPREVACKLLVEKRARLADHAETKKYHAEQAELRKAWEKETAERKVHVQVVSELESAPMAKRPRRR